MRLRDRMKSAAQRAAKPLSRYAVSTNPERVSRIVSSFVTPNWTHEGQGRMGKMVSHAINHDGDMVPFRKIPLTSRTKKHTAPVSSNYRTVTGKYPNG